MGSWDFNLDLLYIVRIRSGLYIKTKLYIVRIRSKPLWTIYKTLLYIVRIRSKPLWTIYTVRAKFCPISSK